MNQGFKNGAKSLMNFNTPAIQHEGNTHKKEKGKFLKISPEEIQECHKITNILCNAFTARIIKWST